MKKISTALIAIALSSWLAGCKENKVTSSEAPPPRIEQGQGGLTAPVALPEGILGGRPEAGITDEEARKFEDWCRKYGLDPKDPAMLDLDSDRDGYSNREEYIAGTNPLDPLSMPGVLEGVALLQVNDVRVPLLLREVKDGKARIERLDKPGTEEFQEGAMVKGLPYRVASVKHEVKADKHGVFTDVSRVMLENPDTKESVMLVRDLPARSSDAHAVLGMADGTEKKVHVDEVVELPGHKGKQFRVIELRPEQVVIEEIGTRRPLTIPKR